MTAQNIYDVFRSNYYCLKASGFLHVTFYPGGWKTTFLDYIWFICSLFFYILTAYLNIGRARITGSQSKIVATGLNIILVFIYANTLAIICLNFIHRNRFAAILSKMHSTDVKVNLLVAWFYLPNFFLLNSLNSLDRRSTTKESSKYLNYFFFLDFLWYFVYW